MYGVRLVSMHGYTAKIIGFEEFDFRFICIISMNWTSSNVGVVLLSKLSFFILSFFSLAITSMKERDVLQR